MQDFKFSISQWAPFRDEEVCERVRNIKRKDIEKHSNPNLSIKILKDTDISFMNAWDIFNRIKQSSEENKKLVLILPQPHPLYSKVAYLINKFNINCKNLWTFNMDEWADEDGNIAPETYRNGFLYAMKHNFYYQIEEKLRPPENQIIGPTNKNFKDYEKMIDDLGGADVCYGGIGWSGHLAFIEPGSPEFKANSLEEWKEMGPRIVTLSPFTIAQSSLDPDFGMSGDWSAIPPKAATIGPRQILQAKLRCSWNSFTISQTLVSWQRFTVRLALFGPVTPDIPASMLQLAPSNFYMSESIAKDIEPSFEHSWY